MKVIINKINFYNNVIIINHSNDKKSTINCDNYPNHEMSETDFGDTIPHVVVNDNENHTLIAQLEARILQSENEKKELLNQLHRKLNNIMEAKQ
jgi:hypothetical protein